MVTTKTLTVDYTYKWAQLKINRFSPAPPFNNLPRDQHFGQQKRRRRGQNTLLSFSPVSHRWYRKKHLWVWQPKKKKDSRFWSVRLNTIKKHKTTKKKERRGTISMIELFDVLLAITSVLSLVTCTIWCNRCVLEWRLRRRARRRNPGMFRKPAPVTPTKHVVEKPEPLGATPEPEHIYMEIDLEQPPPWDSVAPPPYTRTEATQISYI